MDDSARPSRSMQAPFREGPSCSKKAWVAVKELKLSYPIYIYIFTVINIWLPHHGNLI